MSFASFFRSSRPSRASASGWNRFAALRYAFLSSPGRRVLRDAEELVVREVREMLALVDDLDAELGGARVVGGIRPSGARFARRGRLRRAAARDLDLDLRAVVHDPRGRVLGRRGGAPRSRSTRSRRRRRAPRALPMRAASAVLATIAHAERVPSSVAPSSSMPAFRSRRGRSFAKLSAGAGSARACASRSASRRSGRQCAARSFCTTGTGSTRSASLAAAGASAELAL